jgi:predicted SAM-dependent methyltransferase
MPVAANLRRRAGALLSPSTRRFNAVRRELADRYLHGEGIEIGALHRPLVVPSEASVRFVDRHDAAGLRRHYPELDALPLVPVDIVDDGETLETLPDGSVDFIIANHFIEHTQSPLATLRNHLRVLKPGGVLYLAVPDKRHTFDVSRPVTDLEHVVRDLEDGPAWSREQHFREWALHVDKAADVEAHAAKLMADDYSIHFHVWTPDAFVELLEHARSGLGLPLEIEQLQPNQHEFIAILRRSA